jgi:hypothetical protein
MTLGSGGVSPVPGSAQGTLPQFHGMYYGAVSGNADPKGKNRCLLRVPQLLGSAATTWAVSMTPLASPPAVGSLVAVVFLGGDLDHPAYMVVNPRPPTAAASLPAGSNGLLVIDGSNQGGSDVSANVELFSKNASGNGQTAITLNAFTVFMQGGFQTGPTSNAVVGGQLTAGNMLILNGPANPAGGNNSQNIQGQNTITGAPGSYNQTWGSEVVATVGTLFAAYNSLKASFDTLYQAVDSIWTNLYA